MLTATIACIVDHFRQLTRIIHREPESVVAIVV